LSERINRVLLSKVAPTAASDCLRVSIQGLLSDREARVRIDAVPINQVLRSVLIRCLQYPPFDGRVIGCRLDEEIPLAATD
jgi:hypothetical protein